MKKNVKLWIVAVLGLLSMVGLLAAVKGGQFGAMSPKNGGFVPPPEVVTSAKVQATQWRGTRSAIGSLVAVHGVTLGAELAGMVREIDFDSGSWVKRGAVLVKLDTSAEEAQLAAAEADAALARINLDRAQSLRKSEANTPADLDMAEARAKQADAAAASLRAVIAKKTIRAPFDGRITIRQVELGQVLTAGAPVASLHSVDPMYVDFWLPQQALAELKRGQAVRVRTDTFAGASWDGAVNTVNTEVDAATRNVRVRAMLANADGRLRPGMFANVELLSQEEKSVLLVPATAVLFAPYGDSVFVLEAGKGDGADGAAMVARQRFVRLGQRRGDLVAVESGLTAEDTVVSSGAFKLRNGMAVVVRNELAPKAEVAPVPTDR